MKNAGRKAASVRQRSFDQTIFTFFRRQHEQPQLHVLIATKVGLIFPAKAAI